MDLVNNRQFGSSVNHFGDRQTKDSELNDIKHSPNFIRS